MNYWPLSVILNSPLMPSVYAVEVQNIYNVILSQNAYTTCIDVALILSERAYSACIDVARQLKPMQTGLAIIESEDIPARYGYIGMPTPDEWQRFERAGVVQAKDGRMLLIMEGLQ